MILKYILNFGKFLWNMGKIRCLFTDMNWKCANVAKTLNAGDRQKLAYFKKQNITNYWPFPPIKSLNNFPT